MKRLFAYSVLLLLLVVFSTGALAVGFDVDQIYDSVFVIESGNALGSGFAIDKQLIVTNAHVIDSQRDIIVRSYNNELASARLAGYDAQKDIAVLYVKDAAYLPIKTGDISSVKVGDDVYAIGAPKSLSYTLTKGIISNKNREYCGMPYLQIDAAVNEGNSGGPLLNSNGEVIGVNTLKMLDSEGIALSIPINIIMEFIDDLSMPADEPDETTSVAASDPANAAPTEQNDSSAHTVNNHTIGKAAFFSVCAIAALSVILNIVLLISIRRNKTKDIVPTLDQSDRTDFEIDILE